ncbi:DUF4358 domain-containing protein [Mediterraneibacter agrestimuris]|uniref:DUF4358 domain-containing protein n=1 Tax=Mediterraneibacter agrestimuris TaxID=2941333 RepID=UPI00203B794E|nr:DUF4358 domain-containing protein [Mediterraneibacter agrestimuris]
MKRKQRKRRDQTDMAAVNRSVSRAEIYKYIMAFALLLYIVLLLIYSSGSTKSFEEAAGNVEAGIQTDSLVKQNAQALKRHYGLNGADYEGAVLYMAEDSISVEEILMVKVKNDQQVHIIQDAVRDRVNSRKNSLENVSPEQVKLLDKARILVRGRFVFFAVSKNAQEYAELFTESL